MAAADPEAFERRALIARLIVVSFVACVLVALIVSGIAPSPDEIRDWGDGLGPLAPVIWPFVFCALNMVLIWPVIAGATGLVFGTAVGTLLSMAGVLLATALQFMIARHVAGPRLRERILARAGHVDALLERNDFEAAFVARLVPAVPWGVVNYVSGLAKVRLVALLAATLTAGAPKVFAYTALGGSLGNLGSPEAKVAVALLVVLALAGLVLARRRIRAERGAPYPGTE